MVLAPMRGQNIPGFSALLFQLSLFSQRQPKVVSDQCSTPPLSGLAEFDGVLVEGQQLIARLAVHVAITATQSSCFTKSVCSSWVLPVLLRIRVLEGV